MAGHLTHGWTVYKPSHTGWTDMSIKCDAATAANNGSSYDPAPQVNNFWPLHRADLRAVGGRSIDGHTDSCISTRDDSALFLLGSTFVDYFGNSYITKSLRVERFRVRDLK